MKGSITDIPLIIVGIFMFAVAVFFGYAFLIEVENTGIFSNISVANQTIEQGKVAFGVIDASMLFLIIGLGIASAISAYFVNTHPVFFILSLIAWAISFAIAAIFSNVFAEIAGSAPLLSVSGVLTGTTNMVLNFPYLVALIGAVIIIATYAKKGPGGGGEGSGF